MISQTSISATALIIGFLAAFTAGLFACKWMIGLVKKGNLIYFSIYCLLIGLIAIFAG
jgi:undecaprenyl-diphosphatase